MHTLCCPKQNLGRPRRRWFIRYEGVIEVNEKIINEGKHGYRKEGTFTSTRGSSAWTCVRGLQTAEKWMKTGQNRMGVLKSDHSVSLQTHSVVFNPTWLKKIILIQFRLEVSGTQHFSLFFSLQNHYFVCCFGDRFRLLRHHPINWTTKQ